jgi:tetratricopeptide (TPR) repeat protein/MFS family permease
MVIELVAGRVISRHLGSSLYTWTSVIGIVLAGIALGNYVGGRLADRHRAAPTLATLFILSSIASVTITVLNNLVGNWLFLWTLPWPIRVGLHVAFVFLAPSVVLGMISPVAAKMALDHSAQTGRTIGSVYAWGVIGSIAGTFATGFYLIAAFGTASIIWAVGGVLGAMAIFYGLPSLRPGIWGAIFLVLVSLGTGPWAWAQAIGTRLALREEFPENLVYFDESQYSLVRVFEVDTDPPKRNMHLDKLVHSTITPSDPFALQYGYERIYSAITHRMMGERDSLNTLTIGGGGYVFPAYLDHEFARSRTEVVEIDPAVTKAALEAFGLPADHDLIVHHEDGRAVLTRLVEKRRTATALPYDFIFFDAVNDYSVPYQLTTVECMRQTHALLADDGALLMNMIDVFAEGRFLGALVKTIGEIYPFVNVFCEGSGVHAQPDVRNTFIVCATKHPLSAATIAASYDSAYGLYHLTQEDVIELERRAGNRPLTDDWAPVENMLAPVVKKSSRDFAGGMLAERAAGFLEAGDRDRAVKAAKRSLTFDEEAVEARLVLGNVALEDQNYEAAIEHYGHVVRTHPERNRVRLNLAGALARVDRTVDAITVLETAVRLEPDYALALQNLGILRLREKRVAEAVDAFRRVTALRPTSADAHANLGTALLDLGSADEARSELREALRLDPGHARAAAQLQRANAIDQSPQTDAK